MSIVRRDETSLLTSLGEVVYHKTLFKNVATGESCYLLDQLMGLEHHARITEDTEARILKEASESSYRKGGANASIKGDCISKEAVMNKLHKLEFPALKADEKKELKTIYIDADEDHVSLQYLEHKGDIRKPRMNTVMPRIIYVYEGVDTEEGGRPKLINGESQQEKAGNTGRSAGIRYSLSTDQKDSSAEESHLGFVKERKEGIMVKKTLILKQISGMLCLLNSYSKFTQPHENIPLQIRSKHGIIWIRKQKSPQRCEK